MNTSKNKRFRGKSKIWAVHLKNPPPNGDYFIYFDEFKSQIRAQKNKVLEMKRIIEKNFINKTSEQSQIDVLDKKDIFIQIFHKENIEEEKTQCNETCNKVNFEPTNRVDEKSTSSCRIFENELISNCHYELENDGSDYFISGIFNANSSTNNVADFINYLNI